jgi:hypothetical protein
LFALFEVHIGYCPSTSTINTSTQPCNFNSNPNKRESGYVCSETKDQLITIFQNANPFVLKKAIQAKLKIIFNAFSPPWAYR